MLPLTRKENWLAKIAGDPQADEAMTPRTREEYFLNEIAENGGGGGGGGGGVLIVHTDIDTGALDKTWQEIYDAPMAVVVNDDGATRYTWIVAIIESYEGYYAVTVDNTNVGEMVTYTTDTANGYPVIDDGGGE